MPEGRLDYWEEELLDLVSMAWPPRRPAAWGSSRTAVRILENVDLHRRVPGSAPLTASIWSSPWWSPRATTRGRDSNVGTPGPKRAG